MKGLNDLITDKIRDKCSSKFDIIRQEDRQDMFDFFIELNQYLSHRCREMLFDDIVLKDLLEYDKIAG
jgi:hypothetical protein